MTNRFLKNNFFKGKKVLVTGHTGFKGAWLSLLLNKLDAQVFGYALSPPTNPNLYELTRSEEFVKSYISDIRNFDQLKKVIKESQPDIVIHMAAQSLVKASYKDPRLTYETNVMGTVNLLEAVRVIGGTKVLLNVTTDKCYENKEWEWGYRENDRLGGKDPYSNSKACSELVTEAYRNSFFKGGVDDLITATSRSGNIIGGGDWSEDRLIPDFVRSRMAQEQMVIRNPAATRPWQYILDSLCGYLNLVEKLYTEGSAYAGGWNFGPEDDNHKSVEWIINRLCEKWDSKNLYTVESDQKVHEANFLKLDSSKSKTRLNWSNTYPLEKTLDKTADWYRRYLDGEDAREISVSQIKEFIASLN